MKARMTLCGVAIVACLAFAIPTQDTRDTRQDEYSRKIDLLTRALEVEKKRTTELEHRLDRIDAWFHTLRAASERLDAAADDARKNGFEPAGANPLSRTILLEGMKRFAAEVSTSVPVPVEVLVVPR